MNVRVQVLGNEKVAKALRELSLKASDLKAAWQRIGGKVQQDAVGLAPVLTGRLVRDIRASKAKSQAAVRSGSARVVYAGVQHYGGYNNITPKPYLVTALHNNAGFAEREVSNELDRLIGRLGL